MGSVWVAAMMRKTGAPKPAPHKHAYWEYWVKAPFGYWDHSLTHLEGDRWTEPFALPKSKGRSSTRMSAALGTHNRLLLAWPTDNHTEVFYHLSRICTMWIWKPQLRIQTQAATFTMCDCTSEME